MVVLGRQEDCDIAVLMAGLGKLLPPPPPGAPGPFALSIPGRVEALLEQAGLVPLTGGEVDAPLEFRDLETAMRGTMSSGPAAAAIRHLGAEVVRQTLAESLDQFRTIEGGYRLRNRARYVIAEV